jgi:hypothetical protein
MDIAAFERPVVFRYRVDPDQSVHRVQPMGMNARGFVEEWLSAPWAEASEQVAPESSASLQKVHADFDPPVRPDSNQFTSHTYGPVRACAQPGVFQVEIRSTLKTVVPGKPGGDSSPLPAQYFFVREVRNGYRMISAASQPASACNGVDLMPKADR